MDLSVVVPLFDEEESIEDLHSEIHDALDPLMLEWELIFVDDGSRDGSFEVLRALHDADPTRVRAISFRRNQGKAIALAEGFAVAEGERIVTLDADLQDVPAEIPRLLDALQGGLDLVSGWKRKRHDPLSKTIPSKVFNYVTAKTTGIDIHDFNCGLKAYRREVTEAIPVYGELHRYLPVLAKWQGFKVGEVAVQHRPRTRGVTKYGFSRFVNGFLDLLTVILLTRYDRKPLHLFGGIGMLLLAAGCGALAYLTVGWFLGQWIGDRPLLPLAILVTLSGFQLLLFGLLAELVSARGNSVRAPVFRSLGLELDREISRDEGSPVARS
ncbi:MAG: glycosyltransferase [Gemmatimonadetes bacterium]|nr:glycosyltransferase [Gemmatimonadota bacterium]